MLEIENGSGEIVKLMVFLFERESQFFILKIDTKTIVFVCIGLEIWDEIFVFFCMYGCVGIYIISFLCCSSILCLN